VYSGALGDRNAFTPDSLMTLYRAILEPILTYGAVAWAERASASLDRSDRVHARLQIYYGPWRDFMAIDVDRTVAFERLP